MVARVVLLLRLLALAGPARMAEPAPVPKSVPAPAPPPAAPAPPPLPTLDLPLVSASPPNAHGARIAAARFIDQERTLLTIDHEKEIKLWDVATGALKATYPFRAYYINAISISPDESRLALATKFGRLIVLRLATGEVLWEQENATGYVDVDFHPNGDAVLVCTDFAIVAHDPQTGRELKRFDVKAAGRQFNFVAEFLSTERLVTVEQQGKLTLWNWATGQPEKIIQTPIRDFVITWRILRQPEPQAVVVDFRSRMSLVTLATGAVRTITTESMQVAPGWDLLPEANVLLLPRLVVDLENGKSLARTGLRSVEEIYLSPSGRYLAAVDLRIWRIHRLPMPWTVPGGN